MKDFLGENGKKHGMKAEGKRKEHGKTWSHLQAWPRQHGSKGTWSISMIVAGLVCWSIATSLVLFNLWIAVYHSPTVGYCRDLLATYLDVQLKILSNSPKSNHWRANHATSVATIHPLKWKPLRIPRHMQKATYKVNLTPGRLSDVAAGHMIFFGCLWGPRDRWNAFLRTQSCGLSESIGYPTPPHGCMI